MYIKNKTSFTFNKFNKSENVCLVLKYKYTALLRKFCRLSVKVIFCKLNYKNTPGDITIPGKITFF